MNTVLEAIRDILQYIFGLKLFDVPLHIAYIGVCFVIAYVVVSVMFGLPISILEAITKKKLSFDKQEKFTTKATIILGVALFLRLLYEKAA